MMRMLEAGGMPVVKDDTREPNPDNPYGYYEFEPVKDMARTSAWLDTARAKAIKVISKLLERLPDTFTYYVVFMRRDMGEVIASQKKMLQHRGTKGAPVSDQTLAGVFQKHVETTLDMCNNKNNMHVLPVQYRTLVMHPQEQLPHVAAFLAPFVRLDVHRMQEMIDPGLYRNRG
jgi:hypothetical protein